MAAIRRGGSGPRHGHPAGGSHGAAARSRSLSPFAEPVGPAGDALEREADRAADAIAHGHRQSVGLGWSAAASTETIRRKCAECEEEENEQIRRSPKGPMPSPAAAAGTPDVASAAPTPPVPDAASTGTRTEAAPSWLVDDEARPAPGQMGKTEFLSLLRREICASVDAAMSGTGRDSAGCPWIDHWLGHYAGRSAAHLERALRKYAPEAGGAASARDYLPVVAARVRESADRYAATGEIAGVPDDMPGGSLVGGGLLGAFGGMFFKARPGGARPTADSPESVRTSLGAGQPLHGEVRSRMESAFGASFSHVRVHTDGTAAGLSDRLNAHAFAVGAHVAFGAGTYRPGTPAGDALIAHELAHVVQQGGAERADENGRRRQAPAPTALERDADRAASGAVAGLYGGTQARTGVGPQLRSGLTLSRCSKSKPPETAKGGEPTSGPPPSPVECKDISDKAWRERVRAASSPQAQLALVQGRLCNHRVRLAGTSCPTQAFPDDYDPAPAFNYDPELNRKASYKSTRNCDGTIKTDKAGKEVEERSAPRPLGANAAYWFAATVRDEATRKKERRKYIVLGPELLTKGPLEVERFAEHEMYHVEHHSEGEGRLTALEEVETYVHDFKKFFARMGTVGAGRRQPDGSTPDFYQGNDWSNLEAQYTDVEAEARKPHLGSLVAYYNAAPAETKRLMRAWMAKYERFEVVKDLRTELKLTK